MPFPDLMSSIYISGAEPQVVQAALRSDLSSELPIRSGRADGLPPGEYAASYGGLPDVL